MSFGKKKRQSLQLKSYNLNNYDRHTLYFCVLQFIS